jgi:probable O-glycosylation ligase (exosortase A-associated)
MSLRDFALIGFIVASVPVGLLVPYYSLLVYAWISYMYPHMYTWSYAQTFPSAKLTALVAIFGTLINREGDLRPLRRPENIAMIVLFACFTMSSFFAIQPERAWAKWQDVSKLIAMAVLASILLTTRLRLRLFLLVIALSLAFYGVKGGIFTILGGGEQMVGGAGTSVLAANNGMGVALNMALPFMWYLANEERGALKWILRLSFFLTIPAIMFTYSRASALTVAIIVPLLILKGRGKAVILVVVLLVGGLVATPFIPNRWWNRQQSTLEYEDDASAMSRIDNWKICWRIALDHPLTGAGFEFMTNDYYASYSPEYIQRYGHVYNTHSIYMSILAGHGFPAFLVFLIMIGSIWMSCRRIRKLSRGRDDLKWCRSYCDMFILSLLAFLINGAFVNMEYFDLVYHLVSITASLYLICQQELARETDTSLEGAGILSPVPAA